MKKICLLILFSSLTMAVSANDFSLASRFKFWLLNNEARMLSTISFDSEIAAQILLPMAIIPPHSTAHQSPVENILVVHRKFYQLLDEIDQIYSLAIRFGNGRFSIVMKQARPEIWGVIAFDQGMYGLQRKLSGAYRRIFYDTLIKALDLNVQRDKDLSARLNKALKKLSDEETRLFYAYLDTFSALYPSDRSGRMVRTFIESGSRRQFAMGISRLLEAEIASSELLVKTENEDAIEVSLDDPLAELEKLTAMTEGENVEISLSEPEKISEEEKLPEEAELQDNQETETETQPEPGETEAEEPEESGEDMFNIWD